MEERTRLRASRSGYKGHVTRLFNKIDELIGGEFDDYTTTSLNNAVEQLARRMERITQIDEQLLEGYEDASELESAVLEAEELHDDIRDKIARTRRFIELNNTRQPGVSPPVSQSVILQPQVIRSMPTSQSSVVPQSVTSQSQSINPSALELVSATTQNSATSSSVTNTTTEHSSASETFTPHHVSEYPSTTTVTFSDMLAPPPLIPAIFHTPTLSSVIPQRSLTTTVSAPRSLYEPPMSTHLNAAIPAHTPTPSYDTQQFANSRLPKLTLPMFSGDPLTWQTFWDSFYVSIHANPNLSPIQKFTYLKAQLQGDAARTITGLPLTDRNYAHSIALLEDRYAQPHKLINAHMTALLEMPSPTNSLASLRIFYDSVEGHIRGLSSLGKSEHSYGDILVPILLGKLSPEIRRNLAREHSNTQWLLADLMAAILKEIRVSESGVCDSHNTLLRSTASTLHVNSQGQPSKQPHQGNTESKRKRQCLFCKGPHAAHNCDIVTDYQKRLEIIKSGNLCFNCLAHHRVSQCPSKFRCRKCKKKHHTSLCNSDSRNRSDESGVVGKTSETTPTTTAGFLTPTSHCAAPRNTTCLLKTAVAPIVAGNTKAQANILFDEGAQRSFISAEMANELRITPTSTVDIAVASFGTTSTTSQKLGVAMVEIETESGELIPISVLIVPTIAAPIQNLVSTSVYNMPHLQDLKFAHPITSDRSFTVSLLIGTDYYWSFVEDHIIRGKGPTAQRSKLGYLLSGPLPTTLSETNSSDLLHITSTMTIGKPRLPNIEQFWSIEAVGTETDAPSQDLTFLQCYQQSSISQTSEGIYVAKFPWKENKPHLHSNFTTCKRRTSALLNKLRKTPELLRIYDSIIKEQEKRGFVEQVQDASTTDVHYLPHHPVKKESTTTPIRIVYDCSCRGDDNSASLNDCLTVGPPFLNNLCSIILRFRLHQFAISTDIEKAFLHIKLNPSDRDFTRFLWPSTPANSEDELRTYRFTVVPFGASSSPFMLGAVLDLHLSKSHSEVATDMRDNIYVDNILSGRDTEEELLAYYRRSRDLMGQAKFNLRSWATNSSQLKEVTRGDNTSDPNTTVGLLGLRWNTCTDIVSLTTRKFPATNTYVTKRDVLQTSSQIFDPLGWATPVTVKAKILMQEIWQTRHSWDEPLSSVIKDKWIDILTDLQELPQLMVPRLYFPSNQPGTQIDNMFVFADASTKAYGAVVYLNSNNNICLAMSKNRVAPIKTTTLPRLELMAAVTATRLAKFVYSSITSKQPIAQVHFWTDSQIVLHWIHKGNNPKPFIAHRIQEICGAFSATHWSYTPSADNPADLLTRGLSTNQLRTSRLWTHGPRWLLIPSDWPIWTPTTILNLQAEEGTEPKSTTSIAEPTESHYSILHLIDISRYSCIHRLLAITAYVLRWIHNVRKLQPHLCGPITSGEFSNARRYLVKGVQYSSYHDELAYLFKRQSKCPPLVRQLRLYLDDKHLIRCGGRIHNAPATELTKFPYLLPSNSLFTNMIVMDTHTKLHHGGVGVTVTAIREVYWIPAIRQYVRKLLRQCVICNKLMGKPYRAPDPPPLPKVRVTDSPPFTVTGVDFTGAVYVKDHEGEKKVYICLFTCAATRAVHLEIVVDLTVETFLLAFRRFSSRKSAPHTMLSDNASTFLAAAEELNKLMTSETLKKALEGQNIRWHFIPKRAPWYGGFWERMIGLTKQALKKTLGRAFVTLNQLETIIVEIEAMLNDRPLTYISPDLTDPQPLTPSHLLYSRRIRPVPHPLDDPEELEDPTYIEGSNIRKRVDQHTQLINQFWLRWKREYLTSLREFNNKKVSGHDKQTIQVGDVVVVHDEKPRLQWRLAIIEELIKGGDNLVRAAHVRMGTYRTTRPITKLYPLEVSNPEEMNTQKASDESNDRVDPPSTHHVRRRAASKALQNISRWTKVLGRAPEDVGND